MRRVLCPECSGRWPDAFRKKEIYPRSEIGEPAEYARVVKGVALEPAPSQRVIYVNDVPHKLAAGHYDCDTCGVAIEPNTSITCLTIWREGQSDPAIWEHQYIKAE